MGKVGTAAGVGSFKTALYLVGIVDSNAMGLPVAALEGEIVERIRAGLTDLGVELVR